MPVDDEVVLARPLWIDVVSLVDHAIGKPSEFAFDGKRQLGQFAAVRVSTNGLDWRDLFEIS